MCCPPCGNYRVWPARSVGASPMRLAFTLALLTGTVALAQDPGAKEPDPRFGIAPKLKVYPQATPKQALKSAITAIQNGDTPYLVAHLLDPGFVDLRLSDRAKQFEADIDLR